MFWLWDVLAWIMSLHYECNVTATVGLWFLQNIIIPEICIPWTKFRFARSSGNMCFVLYLCIFSICHIHHKCVVKLFSFLFFSFDVFKNWVWKIPVTRSWKSLPQNGYSIWKILWRWLWPKNSFCQRSIVGK